MASNGGWGPRIHGNTEEGKDVTFRQGKDGTPNEGHTLISDGHLSSRQFDREHNHYGDNREKNGRVEDNAENKDRNYYTGYGK